MTVMRSVEGGEQKLQDEMRQAFHCSTRIPLHPELVAKINVFISRKKQQNTGFKNRSIKSLFRGNAHKLIYFTPFLLFRNREGWWWQ